MSGEAVTQIQPRDDVVLLVVQKRALSEPVTQQLVDDVHSAAAQRPRLAIVLDLSQVRFAPSVALGSLVQMSKSFKLDGRRLALIGVDRRVRESIGVTRLDRILEIHRTLDDVLGATPEAG